MLYLIKFKLEGENHQTVSWLTRQEAMRAEEDIHINDGTIDFGNKPAVKKETGTWKACPYILGIVN